MPYLPFTTSWIATSLIIHGKTQKNTLHQMANFSPTYSLVSRSIEQSTSFSFSSKNLQFSNMSLFSVSVLRFLVGEMRQRFLPGPQGFGKSKLIAWDKKKYLRSSFLPPIIFLHLHRGLGLHPLKWKLSEQEWAKRRSDKTTETVSSCWRHVLY